MKKALKGFTLVELLIVIAIMALLGSMGLVSGKEANSIAEAQKIVENFHLISGALEMYYGDHRDGEKEASKIITALGAYLKNTDMIVTTSTTEKFLLTVTAATAEKPAEWWLTYTLKYGDSKVAQILANKAALEEFMASTSETKTSGEDTVANTYEAGSGKTTVCYRAH